MRKCSGWWILIRSYLHNGRAYKFLSTTSLCTRGARMKKNHERMFEWINNKLKLMNLWGFSRVLYSSFIWASTWIYLIYESHIFILTTILSRVGTEIWIFCIICGACSPQELRFNVNYTIIMKSHSCFSKGGENYGQVKVLGNH